MGKNIFQYEYEKDNKKIQQEIRSWITSEEFLSLIKAFGKDTLQETMLKNQIKELIGFSSVWDYRQKQRQVSSGNTEKARWTIEDNQLEEEQKNLTFRAAEKLGLIGCFVPSKKEYDYILVLGGARMSCLYRMQYAKEICTQYGVSAKNIIGLAGMREVMDSERNATDTYALEAKTEFDLMRAALIHVFGDLELGDKEVYVNQNLNSSWAREVYHRQDTNITLLAAPSGEPEKRRANTSDTFAFFMEQMEVGREKNILLVTSQIYVPYQQMEAIRMLGIPYGHSLETIGFPNEWSAGLQGLQRPENYLQEIRSVLQSMDRLLVK